jgi:anti-sigma regulatory factor (Ser/Thr protein kinase)
LIERKLAHPLPSVRGDAGKLHQVFSNLISNAIKFTPAGGSVAVTASALADGGVSIRICDTGVGMTKAAVALALTPFGQVDAGLSRWQEGAGLGLPIAKALVQLHGGTLEINSATSMGTEVLITLPSRHHVKGTNDGVERRPPVAAPQIPLRMTMSTTAALEPSAQDRDRSIGRIVSVTGAKAIVLLDACGDEGQRLQVSADKPEMGPLFAIDTPHTVVLSIVSP